MTNPTSFIRMPLANAPAGSAPSNVAVAPVVADGWWPAVDPVELRDRMRILPPISDLRVRAAIRTAIATAIGDGAAWADQQRTAGYQSLAAVPSPVVDGLSMLVWHYQRAIGALVKAEIAETSLDQDATGSAERGVDALSGTITQHRRDYTAAIRDLMGESRVRATLL